MPIDGPYPTGVLPVIPTEAQANNYMFGSDLRFFAIHSRRDY